MAERIVLVFINEQHSNLFPEQEAILNDRFPSAWEKELIPASGWTKEEQLSVLENLPADTVVVFASPPPLMVKTAAASGRETFVFHNDQRVKKELPDGKVISTVAPTGWELL